MSFLFSAAVAARNALYDRGLLKRQSLGRPVISVGNLSIGGAGKTPFVILLAELLRQAGLRADILSRGYGRRTTGVLMVDPAGAPAKFGDEPLLLARRLPDVPVIVGESRYEAGVEAERRFASDVHLLDDGFQHRQLARNFDIVLLSRRDLEDRLLPAGRLREPLSSLARASAVVWTDSGDLPSFPNLPRSTPVWRVRRHIELPAQASSRPFVVCAIAEPVRFLNDLADAGAQIAGQHLFRDHHAYTAADIDGLRREAQRSGADGFLTTEKDAVKFDAVEVKLPGLTVVRLVMEVENAPQALAAILEKIRRA